MLSLKKILIEHLLLAVTGILLTHNEHHTTTHVSMQAQPEQWALTF